MIALATLALLMGVLFLFVRQKLSALESRVNLLTDTVQTMAGLNRVEYQDEDEDEEEEEEEDEDEDPEDEEDEPEDEEEDEQERAVEVKKIELDETVQLEVEDIGLTIEPLNEIKTISLEKRVVSDDNVDYESMTLKELKEKVALLGGPKLRTKKELVDFLNKKE